MVNVPGWYVFAVFGVGFDWIKYKNTIFHLQIGVTFKMYSDGLVVCYVVWSYIKWKVLVIILYVWCCLISHYLCVHVPLYDIVMINMSFIYTLDGLENDFVSLPELLLYLKKVGRWFDISPCLMRFDKWDVYTACELCECLELFIVTYCCYR